MVRLRAELLDRLQPLLAERAALAAGLGGGAETLTLPPAVGAATVAALSADYLRWAHQAERMGANLETDHRLMREFCARVTCSVRPVLPASLGWLSQLSKQVFACRTACFALPNKDKIACRRPASLATLHACH